MYTFQESSQSMIPLLQRHFGSIRRVCRSMWSRLCRREFVRPVVAVAACGAAQSCSLPWTPSRHGSLLCRPAAPVHCSPKAKKKLACHACSDHFPASDFPTDQRKRSTRLCQACRAKPEKLLLCTRCGFAKPHSSYAGNQVKRKTRTCLTCTSDAAARSGNSRQVELGLCHECGSVYPWSCFPVDDQHRSHATCRECRSIAASSSASPVTLALGSCSHPCTYCGALLFASEGSHFCCQAGKHAVSFEQYFVEPGPALLEIFRSSWPLTLPGASNGIHTGEALLTGFSMQSRKYNSLFALAQHEIQSTGPHKEIKLSTQHRPANIRIHGTMYRRLLSATDLAPLRYLLVDPLARVHEADRQGLQRPLLKRLETILLSQNPYMHKLRRSVALPGATANASIQLEWHENVQEVAAIVDENPTANRTHRSVCFHMKRQDTPQYLHPLSALYEPLSYPLWFPQGGRGWSTDMQTNSGGKLSQMWWYRQLVLRSPYMHACGRLLNDWFINMYCRLEDERFSHLRALQSKRMAKRSDLCEVVRRN